MYASITFGCGAEQLVNDRRFKNPEVVHKSSKFSTHLAKGKQKILI